VMNLEQNNDFDFIAVFNIDDYLYFYLDFLPDDMADHQIEFLLNLLRPDRPLKILDLACGFGRHANRLAGFGHQVTGIDLPPGFLDITRQDSRAQKVQVEYRQDDMRNLNAVEQYDLVHSLFISFGYFDDEENRKVLQNISRSLKTDGRFVLDIPKQRCFSGKIVAR
jgi:SAM-dependent methyltransferase